MLAKKVLKPCFNHQKTCWLWEFKAIFYQAHNLFKKKCISLQKLTVNVRAYVERTKQIRKKLFHILKHKIRSTRPHVETKLRSFLAHSGTDLYTVRINVVQHASANQTISSFRLHKRLRVRLQGLHCQYFCYFPTTSLQLFDLHFFVFSTQFSPLPCSFRKVLK